MGEGKENFDYFSCCLIFEFLILINKMFEKNVYEYVVFFLDLVWILKGYFVI